MLVHVWWGFFNNSGQCINFHRQPSRWWILNPDWPPRCHKGHGHHTQVSLMLQSQPFLICILSAQGQHKIWTAEGISSGMRRNPPLICHWFVGDCNGVINLWSEGWLTKKRSPRICSAKLITPSLEPHLPGGGVHIANDKQRGLKVALRSNLNKVQTLTIKCGP